MSDNFNDYKDQLPDYVRSEEDFALFKLRHSTEHVLTQAMENLYGKTSFHMAMGPATVEGFYFDFDPLELKITEEEFPKIEEEMQRIVVQNLPISRKEITLAEAKKLFADNPYKQEWLGEIEKQGDSLTIYQTGDSFIDLCKGPHLDSTGEIKAFKLLSIAGAYWHGDEKNKMLTRIYGTAFYKQKDLDAYVLRMEEAKKRDHRRLGKELELFLIDPTVGMGLVMWQPKGALLWRVMEDFWYKEHLKNGYELVRSPHIGNRKLWEISGHWGFYNESMYPTLEVGQTLKEAQEGEKVKIKDEYIIKPMNCPFHITIYNSKIRSYRELPKRWAECGTVYRYEKSGELSGLTRVRGFTQDDAHIICRPDQVEDELKKVIDFIFFAYKAFGFDAKDVNVYLSVRDPKSDKYTGSNDGWNLAESALEKVAKEKNLQLTKDVGGAVFYGPKLDFKIKDALGREWQCSTLQFDFNLPQRFNMSYINEKGEKEQPYVLHRVLFGSFERFIGVLIEHYAGAFPLWLAPEQVRIIPISEDNLAYAEQIKQELEQAEIRVSVDTDSDRMQNKIRKAQEMKIPYMLIVGQKETVDNTLSVRLRSGEEFKGIARTTFKDKIAANIAARQLELEQF